jgi:hypothetical protein
MRALITLLMRPIPISDDAIETAALVGLLVAWPVLCYLRLVSGGAA